MKLTSDTLCSTALAWCYRVGQDEHPTKHCWKLPCTALPSSHTKHLWWPMMTDTLFLLKKKKKGNKNKQTKTTLTLSCSNTFWKSCSAQCKLHLYLTMILGLFIIIFLSFISALFVLVLRKGKFSGKWDRHHLVLSIAWFPSSPCLAFYLLQIFLIQAEPSHVRKMSNSVC